MTPRDRAHTLVTGGAGYLGTAVVDELIAAGHSVRILDVLMHGQHELARELERRGIDVHEGDVRIPRRACVRCRGSAPWCTWVRSTETLRAPRTRRSLRA